MQSRKMSFLEVCIGTGIGFIIAFVANATVLPAFGFTPSTGQNMAITGIYTGISIARGYMIRRLFNYIHISWSN